MKVYSLAEVNWGYPIEAIWKDDLDEWKITWRDRAEKKHAEEHGGSVYQPYAVDWRRDSARYGSPFDGTTDGSFIFYRCQQCQNEDALGRPRVDVDAERLSQALPKAINFHFLPPRTVNDPLWQKIATDIIATLAKLEKNEGRINQ